MFLVVVASWGGNRKVGHGNTNPHSISLPTPSSRLRQLQGHFIKGECECECKVRDHSQRKLSSVRITQKRRQRGKTADQERESAWRLHEFSHSLQHFSPALGSYMRPKAHSLHLRIQHPAARTTTPDLESRILNIVDYKAKLDDANPRT